MKKIMSEFNKHELTLKRCLGLFRHEVMNIIIFKLKKIKSDFHRRKGLENFLMEKSSLPRRNLVI